MLRNVFRIAAVVMLVGVVSASATALMATYSAPFYPCPWPPCATAPNYPVQCKLGRTGPIVIRGLKDCCCGDAKGTSWLNMYRFF